MGAGRLLVVGLGAMLLVTGLPRLRDGGGVASASVRETFREPRVWHSKDGVLRRTLVMRRAANRLGRRRILTLTYGSAVPGPTWRVKPRDRIPGRLGKRKTPPAPAPPPGRRPAPRTRSRARQRARDGNAVEPLHQPARARPAGRSARQRGQRLPRYPTRAVLRLRHPDPRQPALGPVLLPSAPPPIRDRAVLE